MSNQLQITGGAKVRNLNGVITGTTGVLGSVPLGAANGVATLDSSGKVPVSQLPASVVTYLGTWNAATNTPTLVNGTGDPGDLYICNVAGTVNFGAGPISFVVGDWVLYGSGTWQKSSGQNGTVTSVAVTETGDALTITGSPITTAGTINIGFAGTSAQYVAGNGSLITFPSLTGYVPYTGATANVDLGEYELKAGQLSLDVSPTGTASVGTTRWNNTIGLSETTLKGGTVILKNGVDLVARVVNKVTPNTTLTKAAYQAVRVSGAQGQRLAVAFAQANNDNNSADTLGIVIETIPTNQEGFIMTVGQLEGVNTTGSLQGETWADGDVLYLSPTTAGALTNVKPTGSTGHIVVMGYVEYAHANNGSIYVKIMNGWELDELHNVYISSPTNNQGLFYNSSNSLWENKSIATALGYTPANDSLVVKLAGTQTITGTKTFNATTTASKIRIDNTLLSEGTTVAFKQYESGALGETGYTSLAAQGADLFYITWGGTKAAILNSANLSTYRTYTLPNADGTLALTSDIPSLSGYVTLATTQTISGAKTFTSLLSVNNKIYLKTDAGSTGVYLQSYSSNEFSIGATSGATTYYSSFILQYATRSYTFPNADGTIALTSQLTGGTVTSVGLSSATSGVTIGSTPITTSGTITLAIATASGTQQGLLSSTDWTTFNNKQNALTNPVTGTGTSNYLTKFTGTSTIGNSTIVDDGSAVSAYTNAFRVFQIGGSGAAFYLSGNSTQATMSAITSAGAYQDLAISGATLTFFSGTLGSLGSSLAMTINSSGNVSIGNSNNTYKLDVTGTGRFTGALTGTSATFSGQVQTSLLFSTDGTRNVYLNPAADFGAGSLPTIQVASNHALQFATNNALRLTIASSGAATFSSSVTANGNATSSAIIASNLNGATGTAQYYTDFTASSGIVIGRILRGNGASGYEANGLNIDNFAGMQIKLNTLGGSGGAFNVLGGNVGIGTTTPTEKLDVVGGAVAAGNGTIRTGITYSSLGLIGTFTNHDLGVITNGTEKMRITSGGTVLINASTANGYGGVAPKLEVYGTSIGSGDADGGTLGVLGTTNTSGAGGAIVLGGNTTSFYATWGRIRAPKDNATSGDYAGGLAFDTRANASNFAERMRITSGGLVGIGNSAPAAGLDVQYGSSSGNISFRVRKADTITTFYVRGDGYVFAPSVWYFTTGSGANMFIDSDGAFYRSTSSLKYKKDVKNYDKGLAEVLQLRPVLYKGISDKDADKQFAGLIAEEVHDLGLTEFVQYAEDGTPDALAYQNMVSLLIKAIQELKAEIDELKNK